MNQIDRDFTKHFFSHGSNAVIVLLLAYLGVQIVRADKPSALLPYLMLGLFIFLVTEYLAHRFQLHAPPSAENFIKKLQHRLHYDHHTEPNRLDLLFIPVWYLIPLLCVYGFLYLKMTGSLEITHALLFGNLTGLLYYEYVHFLAHINYTPKTAWGRYMKKYHLWHHFKNENYWYGVTNPIFDFVFGTYSDHKEAKKSDTTRSLHLK